VESFMADFLLLGKRFPAALARKSQRGIPVVNAQTSWLPAKRNEEDNSIPVAAKGYDSKRKNDEVQEPMRDSSQVGQGGFNSSAPNDG
jgi:hypothetical protein